MFYFSSDISVLVRQQSLTAEKNGGLSTEVLAYIYGQKLFKLFVPTALNGVGIDLPESIKVFEEAARIDGSFGWLITIGAGGGYFAPIFDRGVGEELFSPAEAVVAGSGHVSGKAISVDGGYKVTGSWRYCSGANYATIFTANCSLDDGTVRSFIFTPDQVVVVSDWDAYGLRATGSHTIRVTDALVPRERTFDIATGARHYEHPVYQYPFLSFAQASFAAVCIGIAKHFLDEAVLDVDAHASDTARYPFVHGLVTRQQKLLADASETFYDALNDSWRIQLSDGILSESIQAEIALHSRNVTTIALLTVQKVYPYLGLAVTMQQSTINRCWRDLHTASQHILLKSFE